MNNKNFNKSGKQIEVNNINKKDGVSKTQKKQPSKSGKVVKTIFFVNFKIFSYIINILLTILLVVIITGGIVAGSFFFYIVTYIDPVIDDLATMSSEKELTTFIYYYKYEDRINKTNPKLEEMERLYGVQNSMWVKYKDITKNGENMYLVYAFISLEDRRFFEHKGVDWLRTGRAAMNFLYPTERTFGGSTITQQLVKMMTNDDDQTIQRKIQEMRRAMYLESKTSKEEILENYLNTVMLSNRCYGVQAAANTFFNKDVWDLNLIEAAAIASIVQSPTAMNPIRRPENNKKRRDNCLENMLEYGHITQEEFDEAYDKELVINQPEGGEYIETVKSYYVDQIINDVQTDLMKKYNLTLNQASHKVFSGGLKIYSCMDEDIQSLMQWVFARDEFFPAQSEGAIKYQAAMVVLDPFNGDLLGIVGGRGDKVQRGLNRASMSQRQPGSSIKPISVYAPALDLGVINWGTPMNDSPSMIINKKPWPPNYPAGNEGQISLSRAVAVSKNTVAVRVLRDLTPEKSFRFCYDEVNMKSLVDELVLPSGQIKTDIDVAPMALGGLTKGVSVYELTAAYSMLANRGIYSKPRSYTKVEDQDGNIILDNRPEKNPVIEAETAWIMTKLLRGVVENGTAKGLPMANKIEVAGKTGTTNDDFDRWFIGYTPYYLCGCWFGYDKPKYLGVDVGPGNPPLMLFNYVMDVIHEDFYGDPKVFEDLPTVVEAWFCKRTGLAPGPGCDWKEKGYYAKGSEPMEECDVCQPVEEEEEEETTEPIEGAKETTEPADKDKNEEATVSSEVPTSGTTEAPTPAPVTEEPTIAPEEIIEITEEPTIGQDDEDMGDIKDNHDYQDYQDYQDNEEDFGNNNIIQE